MRKSLFWIALGASGALLASEASAAIIYSQSFNNPSGVNQPLTYLNSGANTWSSYVKSTALTMNNGTDTYFYPILSGSAFLFVQSSSPELNPALVYVNGSFNTVANADKAAFDIRNTASNVPVRFAVKVQTGPGTSSWYVTQSTYSSATNTTWEPKTIDLKTATWNSLTVNPGVSLSMGGAASLPSGTVTALGWYNNTNAGNWRVDNFSYSIPEPTALAGVGLVGLLALRRARKA